jgi:hypothetical protein
MLFSPKRCSSGLFVNNCENKSADARAQYTAVGFHLTKISFLSSNVAPPNIRILRNEIRLTFWYLPVDTLNQMSCARDAAIATWVATIKLKYL